MSLLLQDADELEPVETGLIPSPVVTYVRLNDIFQKVLREYQQQINKGNIIIRCSSLPVIEGSEQLLNRLFENIFFILLNNDVFDTRHFLHIDCLEDEQSKSSDGAGKKDFRIQFNCSRHYDNIWNERHQHKIDECYSILSQCKSKIILNPMMNNGCSFTVLLPGKPS